MDLNIFKITISLLLIPNVALSQTSTSTTGKFSILKKNDIVLYDGVLYDHLANAEILADKEHQEKITIIKLQEQKEKFQSDCDLRAKKISIELDAQQRISQSIIESKNKEIKELQQQDNFSSSIMYGIVGFAIGMITAGLIVLGVNK